MVERGFTGPVRCPCGVLASLKGPCKRCGRDLHLAHGHAPDGHFDEVAHEWYFTGGTHRRYLADEDGEPCPYVHRHAYVGVPGGHDHEGTTDADS